MSNFANKFHKLFLLRSKVVFLNHGSYGACPRPVFKAHLKFQRKLEKQPVEFLGRRATPLLSQARSELAQYLGVQSGDDLVFVPNVTIGLNMAARSLPLGPGDQVLIGDHEYGAMDRMWRFVCERRGATLVRRPIPWPVESEDQVIEEIWAGVTDRTKVLSLSHMTSATALILPIAELIQRAKARGILTVIDGAHAPGHCLDLNLSQLDPDFYSANCHKWMCAPKGSGFLYVKPGLQHMIQPLVVSWGWQPEIAGPSPFIDENEYQGTRDLAPWLSVPHAIAFQRDHDWANVQASCRALVVQARERLAQVFKTPTICPNSPKWFLQMAAQPLPSTFLPNADAAKAFQTRLYDQFRIEIPVTKINNDFFLRTSIQAYNSQSDVDALINAVKHLRQ